jgi:hypothetical protein
MKPIEIVVNKLEAAGFLISDCSSCQDEIELLKLVPQARIILTPDFNVSGVCTCFHVSTLKESR